MLLLVGIDWADDHHDAALMDEQGTILDEFRLTHDVDGVDLLHERIANHHDAATNQAQVLVAIETSHGMLVHDLVSSGYTVYALNPKAVNRYKDRFRASGPKSDQWDAKCMADILRTDRHRHKPLTLAPDDYRLLSALCEDLRTLIDDTTRLTNRLFECLKRFYPSVIGAFGIDSDIFTALLRQYPSPGPIAKLTEAQFMRFLKANHYTQPSRASEIFDQIKRPVLTADAVAEAAGTIRVQALLDQLVALRASRKEYEKRIKDILDKLPEADVIYSLPGVGKRLTPEITAMLGPNMKDVPKRFEQASQLASLAGWVPVTRQSGRHKSVTVRHACSKSFRLIGRNWAAASINESRWAKAFYNWHRKLLQSHETILRKLAAKWIKIAYHLWLTCQHYDEAKHIAALQARNVPWAMSL
jgi:transposase